MKEKLLSTKQHLWKDIFIVSLNTKKKINKSVHTDQVMAVLRNLNTIFLRSFWTVILGQRQPTSHKQKVLLWIRKSHNKWIRTDNLSILCIQNQWDLCLVYALRFIYCLWPVFVLPLQIRTSNQIKTIWYKVKTMYNYWKSRKEIHLVGKMEWTERKRGDNKTVSIDVGFGFNTTYVSVHCVHVFLLECSCTLQKLLRNIRGTYLYVTKSSRKPVR